jgi:hypothetical protein
VITSVVTWQQYMSRCTKPTFTEVQI